MVAPETDVEDRLAETQMRRGFVFAFFQHMDEDKWRGVTQENLVGFVETLHQRLVKLGPQQLHDPEKLEALKAEYIDELPMLERNIEGLEMSAYDLLLKIAMGVENFPVPPLSAHRDASLR